MVRYQDISHILYVTVNTNAAFSLTVIFLHRHTRVCFSIQPRAIKCFQVCGLLSLSSFQSSYQVQALSRILTKSLQLCWNFSLISH